jgi:hypothetical protein
MTPVSSSYFPGDKFGRLTLTSFHSGKGNSRRWNVVCDCGKEKVVLQASLKIARSCGRLCLENQVKHGHALKNNQSKTYYTWQGMIQRTTNQKATSFPNYGGRGITVCKRWRDFMNFLADMGEAPVDKSIDRIDNNGNYEPGNCRWATRKEQAANKRQRSDYLDLTGRKFSRLTVLRFSHRQKHQSYWLCRCDCGIEKTLQASHLRSGNVKSCGCLKREKEPHAGRTFQGPRSLP